MQEVFSNTLINWYQLNKRDLPWRMTSDPYLIWVSEIILQQTRVAQGIDYYHRFVSFFPTINDLAFSSENDVLKIWQGLGYYSRARNMHKAAKFIMNEFGNVFPRKYKDVISLPGIGEYTAAAICSFAYDEPCAVVDGNVYRVLARVFGIDTPIDSAVGKKLFFKKANSLLNLECPAIHNQAIMEFGALQCVPQSPKCIECPLNLSCWAYLNNTVELHPVKSKKLKIRTRYFNYLVVRHGDFISIRKREKNDIWKNLYEFPLIETDEEVALETLIELSEFKSLISSESDILIQSSPKMSKHKLSHQLIVAKFWEVELSNKSGDKSIWVHKLEISNYPVSKLIQNYFE